MRNFLYVFFFICSTALSQNYELVDKVVGEYPPFYSLNSLSNRIKNDFKTETDKVRAAYTWIAKNIDYDLGTYKKPRALSAIMYVTEKGYEIELKKRLKRKVEIALISRKTLCEGYSAMFVELCNLLNIESVIIKGVSKVDPSEINEYRTTKNHAWNAVKINNKWQLLDITWSSGFVEPVSGKWINSFNDFFYFTNPESFITSHFPQFNEWQLLDTPISLESFFEKPIFYAHYFKSNIELDENQKGEIKVLENLIVLNFNRTNKNDNLYYTLSGDKYVKRLRVKKNKDDTYSALIRYKAKTSNILTLYINLKPAIDFKIN